MKEEIQQLSMAPFNYDLPDERIAKFPIEPRDQSKLLVYKNGTIVEDSYFELDKHLPEETLLLMNNTKVVEARLIFHKESGAKIEIFCLEPDERYADITTAMLQTERVFWKCLVGNAKKWKDEILKLQFKSNANQYELTAKKSESLSDGWLVELQWDKVDATFAEILHLAGIIPLPPYLKRESEETDKFTYQTVYAQFDGSVAAPTAGLHFTERLFEKLDTKTITQDFLTLHVGAGTFKPVKSEVLGDHEMHAEFIEVNIELIEKLSKHTRTRIAVGTTSLRTLESLYWLGVKTLVHPEIELKDLQLFQWDAYDLQQEHSFQEALTSLFQKLMASGAKRLITKTQLLIAPGYSIRSVDGILTNFHQPQSTLLLLIYAFVGEDWKTIYNYAMNHDFRFLSYGDGSLLWKNK